MITAQTLIDFFEKSDSMGARQAVEDEELSRLTYEIGMYLENKAQEGLNGVLEHVSEDQAFKVMKIVEGLIVSSLACDGRGSMLLMAASTGELQKYTHSICMAILGIAMDEEWL